MTDRKDGSKSASVHELKKQLLAIKLRSGISQTEKPHVKKSLKKEIARSLMNIKAKK